MNRDLQVADYRVSTFRGSAVERKASLSNLSNDLCYGGQQNVTMQSIVTREK